MGESSRIAPMKRHGVSGMARQWPSDPVIAGFAGIVLMILVGRISGQDYNWDLLNYHFASPHLLLSGRYAVHVAPSGLQSWFNPIGYIPAYLAIDTLPPWLASVALATASGLNAPLIYLIADAVGADLPPRVRRRASYACVAIGMSGAMMVSEAGTTFLDSTLSIANLGAVYAVIVALRSSDRVVARRCVFTAGVLVGTACGLKLTNAPMAGGLLAAILLGAGRRRLSPGTIVALAIGGATGFLLGGGWWAWRMWSMFGNPVFPMFNDLFRSPFAPPSPVIDTTFLPRDWTGIFTYPWHWLTGDRTPGTELPIVERRYPLAVIAAVAIALAGAIRRNRASGRHDAALIVACFTLAAYAIWLFAFAILRYFVTIEALSGVLLLAAFRLIPAIDGRRLPVVMIVTAFALSVTTRHAAWGRAPFTDDWFGARHVVAVHRPGTVYVLPGDTPLGFLIHDFPKDARFVRLGGTFPLSPADRLGAKAQALIRAAPFVRSLAEAPTDAGGIATLRRFGLAIRRAECRSFRTKTGTIESCALIRRSDPGR